MSCEILWVGSLAVWAGLPSRYKVSEGMLSKSMMQDKELFPWE